MKVSRLMKYNVANKFLFFYFLKNAKIYVFTIGKLINNRKVEFFGENKKENYPTINLSPFSLLPPKLMYKFSRSFTFIRAIEFKPNLESNVNIINKNTKKLLCFGAKAIAVRVTRTVIKQSVM